MLRFSFCLFIPLLLLIVNPIAVASSQLVKKHSSYGEPLIVHSYKFYDKTRNRILPVTVYVSRSPLKETKSHPLPVVIINHGYGVKNTEYSFLAKLLAARGYYVASIQHDLKTDPPLARTGDLFVRRKPLWKRGVLNILFVMHALHRVEPNLDLNKVILIGHSNGGDIAMLFAKEHPQLVQKLISLDSLRMPFPLSGSSPILSLRANDTQADKGVLPDKMKAKHLGIEIIKLENAKHIDLCDRGSRETQQKINQLIAQFLNSAGGGGAF